MGFQSQAHGGAGATSYRVKMREYSLQMVEAMAANGCSLESIEDFIDGRTDLSEDERSALWLLAWTEIRRENRRQGLV